VLYKRPREVTQTADLIGPKTDEGGDNSWLPYETE
jgi:hypothetical protein